MKKKIILIILFTVITIPSVSFAVLGNHYTLCIENTRPNHDILSLFPAIKKSFCTKEEVSANSIKLDDIILDYHNALDKMIKFKTKLSSPDFVSSARIAHKNYPSIQINLPEIYQQEYTECLNSLFWGKEMVSTVFVDNKPKISKTPFSSCASNAYAKTEGKLSQIVEKHKMDINNKKKNDIINRPILDVKKEEGIIGKACSPELIMSQNLKAPTSGYIRNGRYHWYTKDIVREADVLQKHLNRLGFNAGKVDGIIGPLTKGAILRLQKHLGTKQDGYIGPKTRALLNNSC